MVLRWLSTDANHVLTSVFASVSLAEMQIDLALRKSRFLDFRHRHSTTANMSGQLSKIAPNSPSRASPSEIETAINNALEDLQNNITDMRSALRPLQFVSAREVR
jgi:hypothetical protein